MSQQVPSRPPRPEDPSIAEARRRQALLHARRRGRVSTIATGATGLVGQANVARQTLLGG